MRQHSYLHRSIAAAAAAALALAVVPAFAASPPQPGQWTITTTIERDGIVRSVQADVSCLTQEEAATPEMGLGPTATEMPKCRRPEFQRTPTGLTWRLECPAAATLAITSTIVFDGPDHFTGTYVLSASSARSPFKATALHIIDARRTGSCRR